MEAIKEKGVVENDDAADDNVKNKNNLCHY